MTIKDSEIQKELQKSPETAFRLLVSKYAECIYWHIRRIVLTHQDAEDVGQETFVRVFKSISTISDVESLRSWIYRIATNEAIRFVNKKSIQYISLDDVASLEPATESYIDYEDIEAVHLKNAIQTLPTKQRLTFNLRYYDELEYDEIAVVLNSTVESVRANYHNAKTKILKYLKQKILNMHQDFNFNKIGKREPFKIPENFVRDYEQEIVRRNTKPSVIRHFKRWHLLASGVAASAAIVVLVFLGSNFDNGKYDYTDDLTEDMDVRFASLSEYDQDFIIDIYEEDPFINY